jgi:hypothetical protein
LIWIEKNSLKRYARTVIIKKIVVSIGDVVIDMGTEIYIIDDQISKEEYPDLEYAIDKGSVGYLRASIHMEEENKVLFIVFEEYFTKKKGDDDLYDFEANFKRIPDIIEGYINGEDIKVPQEYLDINREMIKLNREMIKWLKTRFKPEEFEVMAHEHRLNDKDKKMWAKSLIAFFLIGIAKQKIGLRPRISVEW